MFGVGLELIQDLLKNLGEEPGVVGTGKGGWGEKESEDVKGR